MSDQFRRMVKGLDEVRTYLSGGRNEFLVHASRNGAVSDAKAQPSDKETPVEVKPRATHIS